MKTSNNFCFYVLTTCMLLFVNQQVIGIVYNFKRGVPLVTENEDGTIELNIERGEELGYFNLCIESGLIEFMKEKLLEQDCGLTFEKTGKALKEWIPTEDELKKLSELFIKGRKYLGLSKQKDSKKDSFQEGSLETSVLEDSVTEDKQSIAKFASLFGSSMSSKCRYLRSRKCSEDSAQESLKYSDPNASETESKQSIAEMTSTLGGILVSKGKILKRNMQKGSVNFISNVKKASKISDPKASITEDKQSISDMSSMIEDSFIADEEYLKLPMQQESENSVQEAPSTSDLGVSGNESFNSLLGKSITNERTNCGHDFQQESENSVQEAPSTSDLGVSGNKSFNSL